MLEYLVNWGVYGLEYKAESWPKQPRSPFYAKHPKEPQKMSQEEICLIILNDFMQKHAKALCIFFIFSHVINKSNFWNRGEKVLLMHC